MLNDTRTEYETLMKSNGYEIFEELLNHEMRPNPYIFDEALYIGGLRRNNLYMKSENKKDVHFKKSEFFKIIPNICYEYFKALENKDLFHELLLSGVSFLLTDRRKEISNSLDVGELKEFEKIIGDSIGDGDDLKYKTFKDLNDKESIELLKKYSKITLDIMKKQ